MIQLIKEKDIAVRLYRIGVKYCFVVAHETKDSVTKEVNSEILYCSKRMYKLNKKGKAVFNVAFGKGMMRKARRLHAKYEKKVSEWK